MFDICPNCGQNTVNKEIDPRSPFALCPRCNHKHPFLSLPLFIITGASGSGKSTVAFRLAAALCKEAVVLDSDILWRPEFATPEDDYRAYRELWLRLALNISQSSLPVVLAGTAIPDQFEHLPERPYFSAIHYLALVATGADLTHRLQSRPTWRNTSSNSYVQDMLRFNAWLKANAGTTSPPMQTLDTSALTVDETVERATVWFRTSWYHQKHDLQ
jgi:hypothetical protein